MPIKPWFPVYTTPGAKRTMEYKTPQSTSAECPISRLTDPVIILTNHIARSEFLRSTMMSHGMGGGSGPVTLYGPDLSQWPSFVVDAMEIFMQEGMKLDHRMNELDHQAKT